MSPNLPRWITATTLIARVAALFCIVLGALVIIGWYSHTVRLVQPWSSFAPVQFNTALGFLFSGSALLGLTFNRNRTAAVFSVLVAMLGVLTGIEYVMAVNLRIDEFFVQHYITVKTSSPGRMGPNVALGFLLCGVALLLSAFFKGSVGLLSQNSLAALTAALGFSALLGYVIGLDAAYGWGNYTQMSIPSGVGFVCIGLGIMSYSISTRRKSVVYLLAVPAGLAIVVFTLTFWQALLSHDSNFVRKQVIVSNSHAVKLLDQKVLLAAAALERNVTRWKYIDGTTRDQWTKDVEQYYKDISIFQCVQWVDASFHGRWVVPLPGNESLVDFLYAEESLGRDAMLRARDSGHYTTTGVLDLVQGGKGFMVCFPIGQGDVFDGFIVATARVQEFFDHQLQDFQEDNYIFVKENGNLIYQSHQGTTFASPGERAPSYPLQVFGNEWSLQLLPKQGSADTGYTVMTYFMLSGGLIIAMGTVWLIRGSARIVEANALLAASEMYQRQLVAALPSGLITTDRNEIIQEANDEAGRQFGYKPENLVGLPAGALLPARYRGEISGVWESLLASPSVIRRGLGENLRGLRQNGSEFPMEVALTPIHRQDELLILVNVMDQTAREEAQNALRYSEEQLQRIIDNSTAVIYMKAVDGKYQLINKRF